LHRVYIRFELSVQRAVCVREKTTCGWLRNQPHISSYLCVNSASSASLRFSNLAKVNRRDAEDAELTQRESTIRRVNALPPSPRLTSKWQSLDTSGSALTGRHQPAARERFPPVRSESSAFAPSFSLVSAGHRR